MSATLVETGLFLSPELAGTLMTPEEFDAAEDCEEGYVYELINGVLVVSPPPLEGQRGPNAYLGHLLLSYQEQHAQGKALDLTLPENLIRTRTNRRCADRALWIGLGRTPNIRRDPATIAVEFVSEAKRDRDRDRIAKRDEYMAVGLEEYWIIDRFRRVMTVVRRNQPDVVVGANDIYRTPLLPGFELPLKRLLDVAEELERASEEPE